MATGRVSADVHHFNIDRSGRNLVCGVATVAFCAHQAVRPTSDANLIALFFPCPTQ
jgi:hypothetical protein